MSDLEQKAIARLKDASRWSLKLYKQPIIITDSGGKDSAVCKALAARAGIPYEVQNNHTTADAPETVYFLRDEAKRLEAKGVKYTINYPTYKGRRTSMWALIPQKRMPPTRLARYCCSILKEGGGRGRFIATGVRWAESVKRQNRGQFETIQSDPSKRIILKNDNDERRRLFETCQLKATRIVNPIIDWEDRDVWDFIQAEHIPCNPLYAQGFTRVGCIGCPLAAKARQMEFGRYPKFRILYVKAFDRMLEVRRELGIETYQWQTGEDVFHWWMEDGVLPGQAEMELDDI